MCWSSEVRPFETVHPVSWLVGRMEGWRDRKVSDELILTFNIGSSTIKFAIFGIGAAGMRRCAKGLIDFGRRPMHFRMLYGTTIEDLDLKSTDPEDLGGIVDEAFAALAGHFDINRVVGAGHRIVHGGNVYAGPIRIDADALVELDSLTALAPLHQLHGLRLIRAIQFRWPNLAHCASFDTAFHHTNPELVRRFAIPRTLHDEGVQRYGFHGLSYKFIARALDRCDPITARRKVVVAHLGSGASLCALKGGVSVDTSMGFSTLDGIPMATRCGALDPGVLLYLLGPGRRTLAEVEDLLYHRSGLLGVSDISADSRDLLSSDRPEAREALALFAFRVAGEVARMATTLGGLDGIVFTAGIGENQPEIRADVAARLEWLGLEIDAIANVAHAERISTAASRVRAFVIPTDEEQVIAEETLSILTNKR